MTGLAFLTFGKKPKSLMQRMMEKLGVYGRLTQLPGHAGVEERAAERCGKCGHEEECAGWLAANENPQEPPEFCRNRDLIARLSHVD
jgi:hypothetical protein